MPKQHHLQISASDLEELIPDTIDELFLPQLFHFGRQFCCNLYNDQDVTRSVLATADL